MPPFPPFFKRRPSVRVRAPSPCHQLYNRTQSFFKLHTNSQFSGEGSSTEMSFDDAAALPNLQSEGGGGGGGSSSNRVMVVVDATLEAKAALQWALSHTLQPRDTIVLLHISRPSKQDVNSSPSNHKAYELVYSIKAACQMRRPQVQVEIAVRHGKEKAAIIVEEAKQRKVSLLVLGQKRRSIMWRLHKIWKGRGARNRVVEYCIQNANCLTIAVRRKGRKHGGYLITTKRHKNFWLLA